MIRAPPKRMTVAQLRTHMNRRLSRLEGRVNKRFRVVNARLDSLDTRMGAQFADVNRRLDSLGEKLDAIARGFNHRIDSVQRRLTPRVDLHWKILHEHEDRIEALERAARG